MVNNEGNVSLNKYFFWLTWDGWRKTQRMEISSGQVISELPNEPLDIYDVSDIFYKNGLKLRPVHLIHQSVSYNTVLKAG